MNEPHDPQPVEIQSVQEILADVLRRADNGEPLAQHDMLVLGRIYAASQMVHNQETRQDGKVMQMLALEEPTQAIIDIGKRIDEDGNRKPSFGYIPLTKSADQFRIITVSASFIDSLIVALQKFGIEAQTQLLAQATEENKRHILNASALELAFARNNMIPPFAHIEHAQEQYASGVHMASEMISQQGTRAYRYEMRLSEDTGLSAPWGGGVIDGIGGQESGEIAAQICRDTLREVMAEALVNARKSRGEGSMLLVEEATAAIKKAMQESREKMKALNQNNDVSDMAAVLAFSVIAQDREGAYQLVRFEIGDSSTYIAEEGVIRKISVDDHPLLTTLMQDKNDRWKGKELAQKLQKILDDLTFVTEQTWDAILSKKNNGPFSDPEDQKNLLRILTREDIINNERERLAFIRKLLKAYVSEPPMPQRYTRLLLERPDVFDRKKYEAWEQRVSRFQEEDREYKEYELLTRVGRHLVSRSVSATISDEDIDTAIHITPLPQGKQVRVMHVTDGLSDNRGIQMRRAFGKVADLSIPLDVVSAEVAVAPRLILAQHDENQLIKPDDGISAYFAEIMIPA